MWYVIEHLPDLEAVLTRVRELLTPGGLFAFATPNGEGISATTNREQFLRASPEDHLSIWEPSRTAAILQRFDLEVAGITVTGHHPERFPSVRGNPRGLKAALLKPFLRRLSHLRGLGDTFECYARAK
jgi:SAM-dependent methyltransferase